MSYLKRQMVPKNWPVPRKGTAYVVRPNSGGVPLLVILRDMLKIAQNRKEVKLAIYEKNILLNGKPATSEKNCATLFDTISIVPLKKSYRMELTEKGKFRLEEISEKETERKIARIMNKKILRGRKTQLNLSGGRNLLSEIQCNPNDSILLDLKNQKVEKCITLKKGAKILVFEGKHSGKKGMIEELNEKKKTAKINLNSGDIQVLIKQLVVIEK